MKKNDKVEIIDTGDVWEGKTGTVLSEGDELITVDGDDLTEVTVRVDFGDDDEKHVDQIFARKYLKSLSTNETLHEDLIIISNIDDFTKCFLGKDCRFKGFDYDDIYCKKDQGDGEFDYDPEDKAEIEGYRALENQPAKIVGCLVTDGFDECDDICENFNRCFWDIDFGNGAVLESVCGKDIDVDMRVPEKLKEDYHISHKNIDDKEDVIKPYVSAEDADGNRIPSWCFVSTIANAEGITECAVDELAEKFKYKRFCLSCGMTDKDIVADKNITKDDIWADYGDFINGPATLFEYKY